MCEKDKLTEGEVFESVADAGQLYTDYLKISETLSATDTCMVQEDYNRDINHPLSIVIRG